MYDGKVRSESDEAVENHNAWLESFNTLESEIAVRLSLTQTLFPDDEQAEKLNCK